MLDHPEREQADQLAGQEARMERSAGRVALCFGLALAVVIIGGAIGWWA